MCAYGVGLLVSRWKNNKFARAWAPLVPLVQGTVIGDGGGAATSWLSGTYKGWRIRAAMVPDRNRYSGESGSRYNYFEIALIEAPGVRDWNLVGGQGMPTSPREGRPSLDSVVAGRLRESPSQPVLMALTDPIVTYRASQQTLMLVQEVTHGWAPAPESFLAELELLVRLAAINGEVNVA